VGAVAAVVGAAEGEVGAVEGVLGAVDGVVGAVDGVVGTVDGVVGAAAVVGAVDGVVGAEAVVGAVDGVVGAVDGGGVSCCAGEGRVVAALPAWTSGDVVDRATAAATAPVTTMPATNRARRERHLLVLGCCPVSLPMAGMEGSRWVAPAVAVASRSAARSEAASASAVCWAVGRSAGSFANSRRMKASNDSGRSGRRRRGASGEASTCWNTTAMGVSARKGG
jgi:hypothetical protein